MDEYRPPEAPLDPVPEAAPRRRHPLAARHYAWVVGAAILVVLALHWLGPVLTPFLIGAIFWQIIGFWGVIGEAILKRPEPKVSVVAQLPLPLKPPNCTTLALDRSTGRTVSVPCAERMPLLEEAGFRGRSDLALAGIRLGDAARKTFSALAPAAQQPAHPNN